MRRRTFVVASFLGTAATIAPAAWADAAGDLGVSFIGSVSGDKQPAIVIEPSRSVKTVSISLERGDKKTMRLGARNVAAGTRQEIAVRQDFGTHKYQAKFQVTWGDGSSDEFRMRFQLSRTKKLTLDLNTDDVDLDGRTMHFTLSNPAQKAELTLVGKDGKTISTVTERYGNAKPGTRLDLAWKDPGQELLYMDLKVYDEGGFWTGVRLTPVSISIPHVDVEFESGRWNIRPSEEPKLVKAHEEIEKSIQKLQQANVNLPLRLYVAGYTDTVGSVGSNQTLSTNRARSIAAWFKRKGVRMPVFYAGFGEKVLAKPTPDETPEQANRRALYVLATQTPAKGGAFPHQNWKRL